MALTLAPLSPCDKDTFHWPSGGILLKKQQQSAILTRSFDEHEAVENPVENDKSSTYGCFRKIGVPQNAWFTKESPIKLDDLGVPLFLETPL